MKMTLTNITCNATASTAEDNDDLFLMIQADAGPPVRYPLTGSITMKKEGQMPLPDGGYVINFDYGAVVTGYDLDERLLKNVDSPDYLFLVSTNLFCSGTAQTQTLTCRKNDGAGSNPYSQYVVSYTVSS